MDQQLHTKTLRDKANKIIQQNLDREKRLLKRNEQAEINKNIEIMAEQQLLDLQATFEEYKNQTQTFIQEQTMMRNQWDTATVLQDIQRKLDLITIRPTTPIPDKEKSMNSTQPLFFGKPSENIDLWLFTTQQNMKAANIKADNRLTIASGYLREVAAQGYRKQITTNPYLTYDEFKAYMMKTYTAPNIKQDLIEQLNTIKFTDLNKYISDFLFIANQTQNISEDVQIYSFRLNLPMNLKNEIKYKQPKTLDEAITIARTFNDSHPEIQNINFIESTKWCKIHKTNTHTTKDCRLNQNNQLTNNWNQQPQRYQGQHNQPYKYQFNKNQPQRNINQYNNQNNQNKNYPERKSNSNWQSNSINNNNKYTQRNQNQNNKFNSSNQSNNLVDTTSTTSSKPTSNTSEKQNREITMVESDDNLMCSTGTINGIEVPILFDTGASQSVIPLDIVQRYKLPHYNSNITCNFGNNSKQENVPITNPIEVVIFDTIVKLEFLVLPRHNILIGCDWMNLTETSISTYNKSINFKGRTIYLEPDSNLKMDDNEDATDILSTEIEPIDISYAEESSLDYWPLVSTKITFQPVPHLDKETNTKLLNILEEYRDVFATSVQDLHEPCTLGKHIIDTKDHKPIALRPYRKSLYEEEIIEKEITTLLDAGIIRHSRSSWSAPIVLIPKPDGTKRMCINYKKLNDITIKDAYPIPRIDDIFTRISKSKYYSKFDFRQAYYQIEMDENSINKTAFSTSNGHYEFLRLPFGLSNAPKDFNRLMEEVFYELRKFVEHFFDDATAHSITINEHLIHIRRILQRVRDVKLKLNYLKCKFFETEINLFGHVISQHIIKMNQNKLNVIRNWPIPKNTKQLSGFLGMTGYYRRYVEQFATITASLNALLKKDAPWYFGLEQIQQFNFLKDKLLSEPILRQPDLLRKFYVHCDASGLGLGAILAQIDNNDNEYVCEYASRTLKGSELHYSITEKECLAVIWAIKIFRHFLYGTQFTVVTDHKALLWLINLKDPLGRLARWHLYLLPYQITFIHRPGTQCSNVDALSRCLYEDNNIQINSTSIQDEPETSKILDPYEDSFLMHYLKYGTFIPGSSQQQCKRIHRVAPHYKWYKDQIYYTHYPKLKDFNLIVPKQEEREEFINRVHQLGHFKAESTYN